MVFEKNIMKTLTVRELPDLWAGGERCPPGGLRVVLKPHTWRLTNRPVFPLHVYSISRASIP
jgi:hypothetical protein